MDKAKYNVESSRECAIRYYYKNREKVLAKRMTAGYYDKRINTIIDFSVDGQPFAQVKLSKGGRPRKYF